uniref:Uncharacterized protein n=1 Tax=Panulirus argus virus 1 TaxID=380624 RepID=A0A6G9HDQ2_9VIRU|nr:hypothetical protein [Panulirus argus virus 1]
MNAASFLDLSPPNEREDAEETNRRPTLSSNGDSGGEEEDDDAAAAAAADIAIDDDDDDDIAIDDDDDDESGESAPMRSSFSLPATPPPSPPLPVPPPPSPRQDMQVCEEEEVVATAISLLGDWTLPNAAAAADDICSLEYDASDAETVLFMEEGEEEEEGGTVEEMEEGEETMQCIGTGGGEKADDEGAVAAEEHACYRSSIEWEYVISTAMRTSSSYYRYDNGNPHMSPLVHSVETGIKYLMVRCTNYKYMFNLKSLLKLINEECINASYEIAPFLLDFVQTRNMQDYIYANGSYEDTVNPKLRGALGPVLSEENTINLCASALRTFFLCVAHYIYTPIYKPSSTFLLHIDRTCEGFIIPPLNIYNFSRFYSMFLKKDYCSPYYRYCIFEPYMLHHCRILPISVDVQILNVQIDRAEVERICKNERGNGHGTVLINVIYCPEGKEMDHHPKERPVVSQIKNYIKLHCKNVEFGRCLMSIMDKISFFMARRHLNDGDDTVLYPYSNLVDFCEGFTHEAASVIRHISNKFSDCRVHFQCANLFNHCLNMIKWGGRVDDIAKFISLTEDLYSYQFKNKYKILNELRMKTRGANEHFIHTRVDLILKTAAAAAAEEEKEGE